MMEGAVDSVIVSQNNNNVTLRGRRAHACLPCHDRGGVCISPVPPSAPGGFTVPVGALLSILEWVELEDRGFPDLVEGLRPLRGAVMVAAAAVALS
jgi:hypothetical protein